MQKVRKSFSWGSLTFSALWHFAEGLFFFINYFSEKEGFL